MRTSLLAILAACVLVMAPLCFAGHGGGGGHGGGHGGHGGHGHGGHASSGSHASNFSGRGCPVGFTHYRKELCQGINQFEGGSYENAVQHFSGIVQKDPNSIYGQAYLGMAYETTGDQENALKFYKLGAANPSHARVRVELDGEYQKAQANELCQTMAARIEAGRAGVPNKEQP
jgi:tetratricopeptide (TPR) repeat protein